MIPFMTLETVFGETPARRATSLTVARKGAPLLPVWLLTDITLAAGASAFALVVTRHGFRGLDFEHELAVFLD